MRLNQTLLCACLCTGNISGTHLLCYLVTTLPKSEFPKVNDPWSKAHGLEFHP